MVGSGCSQPLSGQKAVSPSPKPLSPSPSSVPTNPGGLPEARCAIPPPPTWTKLIEESTPILPGTARVIPFTTGSNPSLFFAELYSPAWSGVVSVTVPSGTITHIHPFRDPSNEQAISGGFDGRWLVWLDQLSLQDGNDWQLWAWDKTNGQSFEIGAAPVLNGSTVSGPIVQPVVWNGEAAWVQANQGGVGELHLYSLVDHHDRVVASGATYPVLFWGSALLWQHIDVAGQSGHLQMIDAATTQPAAVPAPLSAVRHLAFLAVSDRLVAWTDGRMVWAYRPGQTSASLVYDLTADSAGFLGVAGDLITWDGSSRPYALDVRSGTVTTITPAFGGRFASGNSLLIYWPNSQSKSASAAFLISDVDALQLPALPRCG